MHFQRITCIVLALGTSVNGLVPRAQAVVDALNTVNTDNTAAIKACRNYDGSINGASPLANAITTMNNDLKTARSTSDQAGASTSSEAVQYTSYFSNTMQPNLKSLCDCLVGRKSSFTTNGLKPTFANMMKDTATYVNALLDSIITNAPSAQKTAAQNAKTSYNDQQQTCQSNFNS